MDEEIGQVQSHLKLRSLWNLPARPNKRFVHLHASRVFGLPGIARYKGDKEAYGIKNNHEPLSKKPFRFSLHGDGLLKFQGGTHELFHLTAIVLKLVIVLAVGQVKFFHAGEFDLELFDLLESEMGIAGLRFTAEHLANEEWEGAPVREHGPVHDLYW